MIWEHLFLCFIYFLFIIGFVCHWQSPWYHWGKEMGTHTIENLMNIKTKSKQIYAILNTIYRLHSSRAKNEFSPAYQSLIFEYIHSLFHKMWTGFIVCFVLVLPILQALCHLHNITFNLYAWRSASDAALKDMAKLDMYLTYTTKK